MASEEEEMLEKECESVSEQSDIVYVCVCVCV